LIRKSREPKLSPAWSMSVTQSSGSVTSVGTARARLLAELRGQAFEAFLAAGGEDDVASFASEEASRGFADAGGRAGDDGGLAVESVRRFVHELHDSRCGDRIRGEIELGFERPEGARVCRTYRFSR
jgi:hypothetical protein